MNGDEISSNVPLVGLTAEIISVSLSTTSSSIAGVSPKTPEVGRRWLEMVQSEYSDYASTYRNECTTRIIAIHRPIFVLCRGYLRHNVHLRAIFTCSGYQL